MDKIIKVRIKPGNKSLRVTSTGKNDFFLGETPVMVSEDFYKKNLIHYVDVVPENVFTNTNQSSNLGMGSKRENKK